jgi:hypothetical protein
MVALAIILLIWLIAMRTPVARSGDELRLFGVIGVAVTAIFLLVSFIHWLFCWRNFKRFLFGLACFATLIALFYAEEDWRGWHAWNQFKHEWEAKGEHFDFASIVPPPVPDDQNFAMSPVWVAEEKYNFLNQPKRAEAWYGKRIYDEDVSKIVTQLPVSVSGLVGTNWWSHRVPNVPESLGDWTSACAMGLKLWQSYYRDLEMTNPAAAILITPQPQSPAADVLLALSKFEPVIEKLRADSALPYARFPIQYDTECPAAILLPNLAAVKQCVQVLQLRAVAELQTSQPEKALADVKLSLRLADTLRSEPFLISHLVRIAVLKITLQPVWEGLADHRWSDAQLVALDAELAKLDFLADYKLSMRSELGWQTGIMDYLRRHPEEIQNMSNFEDGHQKNPPLPDKITARLIPAGWFDQNQLRSARRMVEDFIPLADVNQETVSPVSARHANETLRAETKNATPYNILEKLLLPWLGNVVEKFACSQTFVDLARTAIALERYRLAHGEFPEALDALAPQFIAQVPHDVIGGGPLKYRREADGQFVLYSVGWNETDDGGVVVNQKSRDRWDESSSKVDISQGDWVWRYPQKE